MKNFLRLLIIFLTTCCFAQDGTLDFAFNPSSGTNSEIFATVIQSDGKILIGGSFTNLNDFPCKKLGRLNADGTVDVSFNLGSGFNDNVYSLCVQPDGKIIVGGDFTSYNGVIKSKIIRLNVDGTVDSTFNIGTGFNSSVNSICLQPDGKIVVGGSFSSFDGYTRYKIVRLNNNGIIDSTFDIGIGANSTINSCVIQSDGKIIIGGSFTSYNFTARGRIARLNSNGSLDITFNSITAANNTVKTICLQSDGKIIIGGEFTSYNSTTANYLVKLNADSTIDTSFNFGTGFNLFVKSIITQSDGKLLVVGSFASYNSISCTGIVRLNSDGVIDSAFSSNTDGIINSLAIQSNGKIFLGGGFNYCNSISRNCFASINNNGSLDTGFYPFNQIGNGVSGIISAIDIKSDGKIIVVGDFYQYSGVFAKNIARLNIDGTLDTSFNSGLGANGAINDIKILINNQIIIAGDFSTYNGIARNKIARLNSDGSLDLTFNSGAPCSSCPSGSIQNISIQTDGKIIIVGDYLNINGTVKYGVARLNTNGTFDTTFNSSIIGNTVLAVSIQSDGKIIIGGNFNYNPFVTQRVARLNTNGSIDASFNVGTGADNIVNDVSIQVDGKVIISGIFNTFNNVVTNGLVRLNTDGSLDISFNVTGIGIVNNFGAGSIAIQNDGKIITVGVTSSGIARLNTDGSIDNTFITGTGFVGAGSVYDLVLQNDGKILAGGLFQYYNGTVKNNIARLNNSNALSLEDFNNNVTINIYPNPVNDYLKFNLPNNINASSFEIYDLNGKKIDSNILNTNIIDVNNYIDGIYFLYLKTDKAVLVAKFIKY